MSKKQACGDSNDKCLCTNTIGSQLQQCEQCLFTQLIDMNMKMPDPRVGSTAAMTGKSPHTSFSLCPASVAVHRLTRPCVTAFVTACNASAAVVLTPLTLVPPPSMHGPTDIILNTPATVVVVGFGAMLGGSALYLFASL